ncbi:MAG: hypothetical protein CSA72_00560 [Rhodobacterales bacterium]|nr:MAG: hypothetical protein CSA72_00560 [Rhodobacterales bacterium]
MAVYRNTLAEMEAEKPWTTAEQTLLEYARTGFVILGSQVPETASDAVEIRAELIRHVVLGGCDQMPVAAAGVIVAGAWITGVLDLQGCESPHDLCLGKCGFEARPDLTDSHLGAILLPGCHLPGLKAQRARVDRDVHLRDQFQSVGTVDLRGASIGGQLACNGGSFDGAGGDALTADALSVGANVFMSDGFEAKGSVNLRGGQIGGQLACDGGSFDGAGGGALNASALSVGADVFLRGGFEAKGCVNLRRAQIGGQLSCSGGTFDGAGGDALTADALSVGADVFLRDGFKATGNVLFIRTHITGTVQCQGAVFRDGLDFESASIGASFFWKNVTEFEGPLDLTDCHVGRLHDDAESWAKVMQPILGGFRYDRLSGAMSVAQRLDWLGRKPEARVPPAVGARVAIGGHVRKRPLPFIRHAYAPDFDPQPYTQLAQVYRQQGAPHSAARVLERREGMILAAAHRRAQAQVDGSFGAGWRSLVADARRPLDWLFGRVFGYGQRPGKALLWVAAIVALNWMLYARAYDSRQMAPDSDVVMASPHWIAAVARHDQGGPMPLETWLNSPDAQDYTTFSAPLYAFDLFIPLDALGQEDAWAPSPVRGTWGWIGFATGWLTQMLGWIITAVSAAAVTGLVGRRD